MRPHPATDTPAAREGHVAFEGVQLYYREIGRGTPVVVLHGGPDFDHQYLLPALDRLADSCRLIYYAQRGRGKSADGVEAADVSLATDLADLDALRAHLGLTTVALLGHSWGGVLAMEYALRHPERTSHLMLMSTAPASHDGYRHMRAERQRTAPHDLAQLAALAATHAYLAGDVAADAAYYRVHFASTLPDPDQRERLVTSLRTNFTPRTILLARAIEERLMNETWRLGTYDLLPQLAGLRMPALVLRGEHDLVPEECARRIVAAIRGARFDALDGVGHFCYLEAPEAVHEIVSDFLA